MQAILVVLLTVLGAALADQPVINTPPSVVQCLPSQVSFSGGTPPYFISVIPGGQPGAAPLQDFGQVSTSPLIWVVPQAAGTSVTLQIRDSEGQLNYSQQLTVQPGKTDCSASSTNTSSSAAATTSPTSTTPVATTPVAGTNTSTASNTTSAANDTTSVNTTTTTPAKTNTSSPATSTPTKGTSPFTTTSPTTASTGSSTPAAGAASAAPASFKLSASLIAIVAVGVSMVLSA